MRILQIHNYYQQPGGEDRVVENEHKLLVRDGHEVWQYTLHNDSIRQMGGLETAAKAIWNGSVYHALRSKIQHYGIDVLHAHNTFPLISPAAYYAAHAENIPVVQTLHNYRLLCPAATLYRDGYICEECLHKRVPVPAMVHRCYRGSLSASAATLVMLTAHRVAGTYDSKVSAYIALSDFAKRKFVEGGLPEERIRVKANCLADDPGIGSGRGGYALFVGRLSPEKGVMRMLDAWERLDGRVRLQIVGDGPLRQRVVERLESIGNASYVGTCEKEHLYELMRNAGALIFPSEWYEGSPMAVIEAMACGTPIIAADKGVLKGVVTDGVNGRLFGSGDTAALAACVDDAFGNPEALAKMRYPTRKYFESRFGARQNVSALVQIYSEVTSAAGLCEVTSAGV